jgi:hypothetical protein
VISSRKLYANRANARASTGPKSPSGKDRSANNARRHGLTVRVEADHELAGHADALACRFAGKTDNPEIRRLAKVAANAQIDVDRIRQATRDLMSRSANPASEPADAVSVNATTEQLKSEQVRRATAKKILDQIRTLGEYERRAISRRNRAFQDIDCHRLIEAAASKAEPAPHQPRRSMISEIAGQDRQGPLS